MRLLVDTNVALWLVLGDRGAVTDRAYETLADERGEVGLSAVSFWEVAIKRSLGKLEIEDRWPAALAALGFEPIPITAQHAARVEALPSHHRDPFDRMLVAQASLEDRALVSADGRLAAYGVDVVW